MYFLYSIFILSLATQILLIILLLLLFCFHVNINISKKKLIKMKETEFLKKKENEREKKTPTLNHETQKKKLKKNQFPLYPFQIPNSELGAFFYIKKIRFHTLETLTCLQFQAPDQDLQKENIINVLLYKKNKIKISLPYFNNNLFLSFRLKSTKKRNNLCR